MPAVNVSWELQIEELRKRTLNLCNTLVENLLESLGVFEVLVNLGNDAVRQLFLLASLLLALVAHPRVENCLGLGSKSSLLLELVSLSLKLSGFLSFVSAPPSSSCKLVHAPWKQRRGSW